MDENRDCVKMQEPDMYRRATFFSLLAIIALPTAVLGAVNSNVTFNALKSSYPKESDREQFYRTLGADWLSLVDNPNYRNTCAIRMSVALHGAGIPVPSNIREAVTSDGRAIILKVKSMHAHLTKVFGGQSWGLSKKPGQVITLPARTGIVLYHADFADATGHVDLWTGAEFVGQLDVWQGIELPSDPDMSDISDAAFKIGMWFLD